LKIPLTQNHFAEVDAEDASRLMRHSWYLIWHKSKNLKYAARRIGDSTVYLHTEVMQSAGIIDHRNGDGLDCRKENLRFATVSQNGANRGKQRNNTSGFKRVSWQKDCQRWRAKIKVRGSQIHLGLFDDQLRRHWHTTLRLNATLGNSQS
jgi:hypothetical protein